MHIHIAAIIKVCTNYAEIDVKHVRIGLMDGVHHSLTLTKLWPKMITCSQIWLELNNQHTKLL